MLDTDIHNIADKNRWMLDINPSDRAVMSMRETQYAIFELKAAQAQDKAVEERRNGKTKDFKEYCKIPKRCVPTRNMFNHEGCIERERHQHKRQEKEAAATKEAQVKLERNGSRKTERKHKRRR